MDREQPAYSYLFSKGYMLYRLMIILIFCGAIMSVPIVSFVNDRSFATLALAIILAALTLWVGVYFGKLNRPVGTKLYLDRLEILEMNKVETVFYRDIREIVTPGRIETSISDFYLVDLDNKKHYLSNLLDTEEIAQRLHELTGKPVRANN